MVNKTIKERFRKSVDQKGNIAGSSKIEAVLSLKNSENTDHGNRTNQQCLKSKYGSSSTRRIESLINNMAKSRAPEIQRVPPSKIYSIETNHQSFLRQYISEKGFEQKPANASDVDLPAKNDEPSKFISWNNNSHYIHAGYKNPENLKQGNALKQNSVIHQRYKSNLSLTKKAFSREKDKKLKNNSFMFSVFSKNFENKKIQHAVTKEGSSNIRTKNKNIAKLSHEKNFRVSILPKSSELPFSPPNFKSSGKNRISIQNLITHNKPMNDLGILDNAVIQERHLKEDIDLLKPSSLVLKKVKSRDLLVRTRPLIPSISPDHDFNDAKYIQNSGRIKVKPIDQKKSSINFLNDHEDLPSDKHLDIYKTKIDCRINVQARSSSKNQTFSSGKKWHIKKLSCQNLHPEVKEHFPDSFTKRTFFDNVEEKVVPKFVKLFNDMYREQETEDVKNLKIQIENGFHNDKKIPETSLQFYQIIKLLGKGSFGKVYLGLQKLTNRLVAIKRLDKLYFKDEITKKKILCEVKILKKLLGHPSIIKLLEVFENKKYVFFVMEYASNGDLLKQLKTKSFFNEDEAKYIFHQIASGLRYIHKQGIIHRDIKLDNILIDEYFHCKICDFGVSRYMKPHELVNEQCGTPAYLAPEIVLEKGYTGFGADIWSLGVLLFCILTGSMPFKGSSLESLKKAIVKGEFEFPDNPRLSKEAKDLINNMLVLNSEKRFNIEKVLCHRWLAEMSLDKSTMKNIQNFEKRQFSYLDDYEYKINDFALDYVKELGFNRDMLEQSIMGNMLNHGTACYFLIEKDFV